MLPLTHNNLPLDMAIGMGLSPDMKSISILGLIPTTNTTRQLVWGLGGEVESVGVFPSTAQTAFVSSDSAADTSTMNVTYLNENYEEVKELVSLLGETGVQLSQTAIRINNVTNVSSTPLTGNVYVGTEAPFSWSSFIRKHNAVCRPRKTSR